MKEYQIRRPVDRPELYSVTARNDYNPSLGVGFVRNIDMEKAVLHLATYLRPGSFIFPALSCQDQENPNTILPILRPPGRDITNQDDGIASWCLAGKTYYGENVMDE